MAWNGTGTFLRIMNWVQDKTNGINITASRVDTDSNDFVGGLNNCPTKDGQSKMTAHWLASADATYDIGSSSVHWRDGWFSRNASIGGTLGVTGATTLAAVSATTATLSGALTGTTASLSGAATAAGVVLGANDSSGRGIAVCKFKSGNTTRANNTVSADPDLAYAVPGAGTYEIVICAEIASAGGGGSAIAVGYTGTLTAAASGVNAWGFNAGVLQGVSLQFIGNGAQQWAAGGAGANFDMIYIAGSLTATGAGTVSFNWGQKTTNASGLVIGAGSYMKVTQLS